MPFPVKIREDSLVLSHRRCCVCHKFAGLNVNVHHIIQEADGGLNTLDNSIVLCSECHCYAGHYNSRHPLGTKFSPNELRRHRDQWLDNCKRNPAGAFGDELQAVPITQACFPSTLDAFTALIGSNFLFEFAGPDSDYTQLLSRDLRCVFFSLFNRFIRPGKINRMLITGSEGSGKTFNTLLLSMLLTHEGYKISYCQDICLNSMTSDYLRTVATTGDKTTIFVIDNIQNDIAKAQSLVMSISHAGPYIGRPLFLFLSRPIDADTRLDIFGINTPVISITDKLIDFENLVTKYFHKIGIAETANIFLQQEGSTHLSCSPFKYRNMALWNEIMRSLSESTSRSLTEDQIIMRAHSFFRRKEPSLIAMRDPLAFLIPLFSQGIAIHHDYACELLGAQAGPILLKLEQQGIIRIVEQDWEWDQYGDNSAIFVTSCLHPTKAKILVSIFQKYYKYATDPIEALTNYSKHFPQNLYYILAPYSEPKTICHLFSHASISAITRRYLLERHLGKKLDRVIRKLEVLDEDSLDSLFTDEVMDEFAQKINVSGAYIVSKMYLLRSLYRTHPKKTLKLLPQLKAEAISATFLNDPTDKGITSLAKSMEIFKNIYKLASSLEAKDAVQSFVRQIIEQCREEFFCRIETHHDFISQLHWMLKRLGGLKLSNCLMEGITPDKLVLLIRTKDINILEFSKYIITNARYITWTSPDGSTQSYYDFVKTMLTYDDLKRIFDNKRSDILELALYAEHDFVANALVAYSDDLKFKQRVDMATQYQLNRSLGLIEANIYLTAEDKLKITRAILSTGYVERSPDN